MEKSLERVGSRPQRTAEEMFTLIAERMAGNSTIRQFCADHNLLPATYYYWQKKYQAKNGQDAKEPGGFTLLEVGDAPSGLFAEVRGIKLYREVSAGYLKALLD